MPIELTTGTPGAGKSLYTVSEVLPPLLATMIEAKPGQKTRRRLCIAGIPDLLIDHTLFEAPDIDMDSFTDPWGAVVRKPGQPPVQFARSVSTAGGRRGDAERDVWEACAEDAEGAQPVPYLAENWWLWVMPGDVFVIDECQTTFRPMAAGRKPPKFISQLAVHRHYGIDMVFITQHPNLLHSAVRALVGKHRHVRRLFGAGAAIVYEWDACSTTLSYRTATSKLFRYKRKAFELYKSAQLHTKQSFAKSWPMVLGVLAVLATPALWWFALSKGTTAGVDEAAQVAEQPLQIGEAPRAAAQPAPVATGPAGPYWPRYESQDAELQREPLGMLAVVLEGEWNVDGKPGGVFGLYADGERVATVMLGELVTAGYAWQRLAPCMGSLRFGLRERRVTCGPPRPAAPLPAPQQAVQPAADTV